MQRQHQVAIRPGQKPRQHFDARHARTQRRVNRSQFQTDIASANHQQRLGNLGQVESAGGIHHPRAVELQAGNHRRTRTGGNHDAIERQLFFSAARLGYLQRIGILESRASLNVLNGMLLRKLPQSAGELLDHAFLPATQPP